MIGPVGLDLLRDKAVRQEIDISEDQASKIEALFAEMHRQQRDLREKNRDLPEKEHRTRDMELYNSLSATLQEDATRVLNAGQLKRFVEIQVQFNGAVAFTRKPVADALGLTDHQKAKYRRLDDEMDRTLEQMATEKSDEEAALIAEVERSRKSREIAKFREAVAKLNDLRSRTGPERKQRMTERWQRSFRKAHSLLTDSQKAIWKQLTGKPFEGTDRGPVGR